MNLFSDPRWTEALGHLPDYLGNHVRVSVTALALGLAVSLPLAIVARNRPLMRGALLGLASIVQTVPGLALLALFYPLLLALAALSLAWFGFGFSPFGFLPAAVGLGVLYPFPGDPDVPTRPRTGRPPMRPGPQGARVPALHSPILVARPPALPNA